MEEKIPLKKEAESISKLSKEPVEVQVGVYELTPDGENTAKTGEVKAYLHRLTWLERNHIRASNTQTYKHWIENDGDKDKARIAVMNVTPRLTIYFALKIDSKAGSERFFPSQEVLMAYPFEEGIWELYKRYLAEFELSGTEWGNFLRARSLGTYSALPAISPVPVSSEATSQN